MKIAVSSASTSRRLNASECGCPDKDGCVGDRENVTKELNYGFAKCVYVSVLGSAAYNLLFNLAVSLRLDAYPPMYFLLMPVCCVILLLKSADHCNTSVLRKKIRDGEGNDGKHSDHLESLFPFSPSQPLMLSSSFLSPFFLSASLSVSLEWSWCSRY